MMWRPLMAGLICIAATSCNAQPPQQQARPERTALEHREAPPSSNDREQLRKRLEDIERELRDLRGVISKEPGT